MNRLNTIWNELSAPTHDVLEVKNNSFKHPEEHTSLKGHIVSTSRPGNPARFMTFRVKMTTDYDDGTNDSVDSVLTFFEYGGTWMFAFSDEGTTATFSFPMQACPHALELAEMLAKGESGVHKMHNAMGRWFTVRVKPIKPKASN